MTPNPANFRDRGWWRDETFLDDLRRHVRERPEKTAVVTRRQSDGRTHRLDYVRLAAAADRFAGALVELGLRPGDVFAAQLTDRWELAAITLGCIRAGVVYCPLMKTYRRRELDVMLRVTEAKVLVTMAEDNGDRLGELGAELAAELPSLGRVFVADGQGQDGTEDFESFFFGTAWEERHGHLLDERELGPDDPYLVLFTSGTTSDPKGVLHSQNTLYAAVRGEAETFGLDETLVMYTTALYTHYTGVVQGMLMPLSLGGTMAFQDAKEPGAALDLMAEHGVTFFYCAPFYLLSLIKEQRSAPRPLPALAWLVSGSAPIPPYFIGETASVFGLRLYSLWGMTENGPVTITRPDDPEDWAAHSDGSPISDMELRIDPVSDRTGGEGVLWVRGPTQCLGYYRRDELYAADLDEDGWFNTGDLARDDGRGGIRITGRAKDMILRNANIAPVTDLESIIGRHPGVRDVAVIGLPDEHEDETICAVVAPVSAASPVTLEELQSSLDEAGMTRAYWPRRLEVLEVLPTTATGKIRKEELRRRYARAEPAPR
ncbi:cyclohexanecarboxylate-CoA ligase [Actinomadura luteofluorescens]|uniref:Cyclohexanecarboxylate-CoA ligase n=1 Tax=Actinomadura luteofluorescens TaxID=46163 RepID=A0A7Y9EB75_9ACTN|nr:AMP-binding protein [Actinomadura luteofluorescens]NYD44427.1 cyclohexanecarboxylate-CoA ligase [Actinomadura luteofluorescens]